MEEINERGQEWLSEEGREFEDDKTGREQECVSVRFRFSGLLLLSLLRLEICCVCKNFVRT